MVFLMLTEAVVALPELSSKDIPFSVQRLMEEEGQLSWELVFFSHSSA